MLGDLRPPAPSAKSLIFFQLSRPFGFQRAPHFFDRGPVSGFVIAFFYSVGPSRLLFVPNFLVAPLGRSKKHPPTGLRRPPPEFFFFLFPPEKTVVKTKMMKHLCWLPPPYCDTNCSRPELKPLFMAPSIFLTSNSCPPIGIRDSTSLAHP